MEPHFPPEIWRNIFRFATFTTTSLNVMDWDPDWPYVGSIDAAVSDPAFSYRSTLPTKKALTLVSKKFREISLEYLFELVQLFHFRTAQALLDAILSHIPGTGTGNTPAKWTKYMIVNLDHQLTMYSSFMDSVMMKIFFFCKNLVALGWKSTGAIGISDLSSLMASIPVTITTLEWYRHTSARSFKSLQNHTALRNLAVSHLVFRSREDRNVTIPFITHLDVREPLKICVNLPSLSHLTLDWAERDHLEQLLGKSKDTIRSIYFRAPRRSSSDEFPATLARMPKLQIFAYDVTINAYENPRFPSSWLGVGRHASLTNIHLFCRAGFRGGNRENGSFSTLRDAISGHLQPLMTAYQMPLSISIMNARLIFEIADFHEDGYDAAANQRFFDDLSASLSSATVQCIVK